MQETRPGIIEITGFAPNIAAFQTTRKGGVSKGPYASLNLGLHVGDDTSAVLDNRERLREMTALKKLVFMQQVHGSKVMVVDDPDGRYVCDALVTTLEDAALCVMTADCLPLLMATADGSVIAAVHCGWRGLQQNIVASAVAAMRSLSNSPIKAWLGPAAGRESFEVGPELFEIFTNEDKTFAHCFIPKDDGRYFLDLYALTDMRLANAQVHYCEALMSDTIKEGELFFSYRREHITGRMASIICKRSAGG